MYSVYTCAHQLIYRFRNCCVLLLCTYHIITRQCVHLTAAAAVAHTKYATKQQYVQVWQQLPNMFFMFFFVMSFFVMRANSRLHQPQVLTPRVVGTEQGNANFVAVVIPAHNQLHELHETMYHMYHVRGCLTPGLSAIWSQMLSCDKYSRTRWLPATTAVCTYGTYTYCIIYTDVVICMTAVIILVKS